MSSRSRSGSRSPTRKRSYKGNIRHDSMSPIRTASGAYLRTNRPQQYQQQGGRGWTRNYQYNNYQQRNYNNYNNRGYNNNYNQRNNYGNRWNRGRGNYRGNWNYNNRSNWNNNRGRYRYNSRSEHNRSRSRSRSKSYDRDRSRSRSYSRSQSTDRSRSRSSEDRHRKRSRSYNSSYSKSSSTSKSRSRSKSRQKTKGRVEKEKAKEVYVAPKKVNESPAVPLQYMEENFEEQKKAEEKQNTPSQMSAFSRSRWDTPDSSPGRGQKLHSTRLEKDEIFDQWDDDKFRAYLLKTTAKKLPMDGKKMAEVSQEAPAVQKKKKKKNKNAESPEKEATKGKKKKKKARQSRSSSVSSTSSSSSSSSWSPIHKAPEKSKSKKVEKISHDDYEQPTSSVYAQQRLFPSSAERTQAVQYPFSHMQRPVSGNVTAAQTSQASQLYPANTQATQPTQPTLPGLGEMHVIGPDGLPVKLVQVSVAGPDGKIMQVMQIQSPSTSISSPVVAQQAEVTEAPSHLFGSAKSKPLYRTPPPPPAYPPPMSHSNTGKYGIPTSAPSQSYQQMGSQSYLSPVERKPSDLFHEELNSSLQTHMKVVPTEDDDLYSTERSVSELKRLEKLKRRQEVLRTRFKPRPAPASSTWMSEKSEKEEKDRESQKSGIQKKDENDEPTIPGLGGNSYTGKVSKIPSLETPTSLKSERTYDIPSLSSKHKIKSFGQMETSRSFSASQTIPGLDSNTQTLEHQRNISIVNPPTSQTRNTPEPDVKPPANQAVYATVPPQLAAQGFKAVYGNPQLLVGPNGEMLQLISAPPLTSQPAMVPPPMADMAPASMQAETIQKKPDGWTTAADEFIRGKMEMQGARKQDSSSSSDSSSEEEITEKTYKRQRAISAGSDKKAKKKTAAGRPSVGDENDEGETSMAGKPKKEQKKKKKKNKKKKEEENLAKEKKKKKKQKEKVESVESEQLKSKDLRGFNEANKRSKPDSLIRTIASDLPLSHIRAIVPRRKTEVSKALLGHIDFDAKSTVVTTTSYEERFVSLFGSGEIEAATAVVEGRIDITKKSVRKFKVHVQGTRSVSHMTSMSLSDRIKDHLEEKDSSSTSQQVSLNVSSLSNLSSYKSKSRSSSESSHSPRPHRRFKSRSKTPPKAKSRSRSLSLPLAYSVDDKPHRREVIHNVTDLRENLDSRRSRSRSWSSNEDRSRGRPQQQRQPYYNNRNNQQPYNNYNQRGRGQYNRGYFNNRGRRGYQYRGNYNNRGWYQNRNQQGYNNRNQNQNYQRYQRYDNKDDHRHHHRTSDRDSSPDRTHSRDHRSPSREKSGTRKFLDRTPQADKRVVEEEFPFKQKDDVTSVEKQPGKEGLKQKRKPSPAQWTHDMFEKLEEKKD